MSEEEQKSTKTLFAENNFANLATICAFFTFVGSIVAFYTNFVLFESWGLSYTVVATPADLIVGAAEATPAILYVSSLVAIGFYLSSELQDNFVEKSWLKSTVVWLHVFLFLGWPLGIGLATFDLASDEQITNVKRIYWNTILVFLVPLQTIFVVKKPNGYLMIAILASTFLAFSNNITTMNHRSKLALILVEQSKRCGGDEHILWTGTSSVVTSCSTPPFGSDETFYVVPREGLAFKARTSNSGGN